MFFCHIGNKLQTSENENLPTFSLQKRIEDQIICQAVTAVTDDGELKKDKQSEKCYKPSRRECAYVTSYTNVRFVFCFNGIISLL